MRCIDVIVEIKFDGYRSINDPLLGQVSGEVFKCFLNALRNTSRKAQSDGPPSDTSLLPLLFKSLLRYHLRPFLRVCTIHRIDRTSSSEPNTTLGKANPPHPHSTVFCIAG